MMAAGSAKFTSASIASARIRAAATLKPSCTLGTSVSWRPTVMTGLRLLIGHGDAPAADLAQLSLAHRRDISSLKQDAPTGNAAVRAEVAQQRIGDGRLAGARFADQPQCFAAPKRQIQAAHDVRLAGAQIVG